MERTASEKPDIKQAWLKCAENENEVEVEEEERLNVHKNTRVDRRNDIM